MWCYLVPKKIVTSETIFIDRIHFADARFHPYAPLEFRHDEQTRFFKSVDKLYAIEYIKSNSKLVLNDLRE